MKKSNLKTSSSVLDGPQTENVLSWEIIFGAEMAHNGFFLCTAIIAIPKAFTPHLIHSSLVF